MAYECVVNVFKIKLNKNVDNSKQSNIWISKIFNSLRPHVIPALKINWVKLDDISIPTSQAKTGKHKAQL